jgi:hypothetical protein
LFPVYNVTQTAYRLATLPDAMRGRVNSVLRLLACGGQPVDMAAGGALLATLGPGVELWLIAAGLALRALAVGFTEVRHA